MTQRIGLVAGAGDFPRLVIEGAHQQGLQVGLVALQGDADTQLEALASKTLWTKPGRLQKMIDFFKTEGITEIIMAGKVQHRRIFEMVDFDWRTAKLLYRQKDRRGNALLAAIADEFARDGIIVVDSTRFLRAFMPEAGQLGKRSPKDQQWHDVRMGLRVAKTVAEYDVGQTVVLKRGAVVAVEGFEGTDEAIRRGALLAGDGIIVVKVSKPRQDFRFDVPVIGLDTFKVLVEVKASCLAIEAGKALFFQREESLALADKNKIAVVAENVEVEGQVDS